MKLHSEAKELYRLYFAANAVDRIQFDDDIIAEVKDSKAEFYLLKLKIILKYSKTWVILISIICLLYYLDLKSAEL